MKASPLKIVKDKSDGFSSLVSRILTREFWETKGGAAVFVSRGVLCGPVISNPVPWGSDKQSTGLQKLQRCVCERKSKNPLRFILAFAVGSASRYPQTCILISSTHKGAKKRRYEEHVEELSGYHPSKTKRLTETGLS